MDFWSKILPITVAFLGIGAVFSYLTWKKTRRNRSVTFSKRMSREEFREIVRNSAYSFGRVTNVSITNAFVEVTVSSLTGSSTWDFCLDFNDDGRVTGSYWMNSENEDSNLPSKIAERVQEAILEHLNDRPSYLDEVDEDEADDDREYCDDDDPSATASNQAGDSFPSWLIVVILCVLLAGFILLAIWGSRLDEQEAQAEQYRKETSRNQLLDSISSQKFPAFLNKNCFAPESGDMYLGVPALQAEADFKNAGFQEVTVTPLFSSVFERYLKEGDVIYITIADRKDFKKGEPFLVSDPVNIVYYHEPTSQEKWADLIESIRP